MNSNLARNKEKLDSIFFSFPQVSFPKMSFFPHQLIPNQKTFANDHYIKICIIEKMVMSTKI